MQALEKARWVFGFSLGEKEKDRQGNRDKVRIVKKKEGER